MVECIRLNKTTAATSDSGNSNNKTCRPKCCMVLNLIRSDFSEAFGSVGIFGSRIGHTCVRVCVCATNPYTHDCLFRNHFELYENLVFAFSIFDEDIFGRRENKNEICYNAPAATAASAATAAAAAVDRCARGVFSPSVRPYHNVVPFCVDVWWWFD